jgi:Domain of unknown function (DUF4150)
MGVTVKVNGSGNSLVHKGSNGISTATLPDVCKTPSPGGPVPVPYPNVAMSSDLANGTTTVKADGGNMIAIKGSEFSRSTGDEPGTAGGVKSSTFIKEATWLTYSFDVKMDGENACRLTDKMLHNHQNAANLAGEIQAYLDTLEPEEFEQLCKDCADSGHAEAQIMGDEASKQAYQDALNSGRYSTGPEITVAVNRALSQLGPVIIGGATDPSGQIHIADPPAGPCQELDRRAVEAHEKVHQERAQQLVQQHGGGPGTPAFDQAWIDPHDWVADELKAHTAGSDEWNTFLAACAE